VCIGFHQEANALPKEDESFCRKTQRDFGVDVYRKSTGDPDLGKSSANGYAAIGA
jgi:hypothetical protein